MRTKKQAFEKPCFMFEWNEAGDGKIRLTPADGLRQRFHFRGDCGLSLRAEGAPSRGFHKT